MVYTRISKSKRFQKKKLLKKVGNIHTESKMKIRNKRKYTQMMYHYEVLIFKSIVL